ncbi:DNA primase [Streptomyces sp. NPDC046716]|uniref:DNA primase n=1 Tax=Streptomyces sp. NPDC046716 TaxID=3157093 RepID=UPI0033D9ED3E
MNNRATLGLAVGAGYFLGRTKKLKLAFAVGTMVAGKKLQLSPKMVMDLVRTQLDNNPQFKELGGQLRQDFRGVGKAATGAILERQMEGLATRLQSSTSGVRDRIAGVAPDTDEVEDAADKATGGLSGKVTKSARKRTASKSREDDRAQDADSREQAQDDDGDARDETDQAEDTGREAPRKRTPAKKTAPSGQRKAAPRKRSQSGQTAKKTASTARKSTGSTRRAPRAAGSKGERDHG